LKRQTGLWNRHPLRHRHRPRWRLPGGAAAVMLDGQAHCGRGRTGRPAITNLLTPGRHRYNRRPADGFGAPRPWRSGRRGRSPTTRTGSRPAIRPAPSGWGRPTPLARIAARLRWVEKSVERTFRLIRRLGRREVERW